MDGAWSVAEIKMPADLNLDSCTFAAYYLGNKRVQFDCNLFNLNLQIFLFMIPFFGVTRPVQVLKFFRSPTIPPADEMAPPKSTSGSVTLN